jgi:hypothetical protein
MAQQESPSVCAVAVKTQAVLMLADQLVAAAVGGAERPGAAPPARRAAPLPAARASRIDPYRTEKVAGRGAAAGVAQVAAGEGHRLCLEQLRGIAALSGAGVSGDRQQPE